MSFARGTVWRGIEWILLGLETRVNTIVVNLQIGATDRPVLAVGSVSNEPLFIFAEQDIGINERTATDSAGQNGTKRFEG